ncbi:MAG: cytochrome C [Gammaproteobacteria bacterium]|nr:cytochrome C [Gammaproteobacteria bacterium]
MISTRMKLHQSSRGRALASLVLGGLLFALTGPAQANVYDEPSLHIAIPLYDEDGNHVLDSGKAYSPKESCGGSCHDYEKITHAFHIEQGRDETSDDFGAKIGLSNLVGPGYYGGYNCMGSNNPDSLAKKSNSSANDFGDHGSAGLIMRCESCHSGGGWMEKDRNGNRYDETDPSTVTEFDGDYYNRGTDENNHHVDSDVVSQWDWKKSGVVENDCFKCHADLTNLVVMDSEIETRSASRMASNVRRGVLIDQGHFRESNTAILEVLNLNIEGVEGDDRTLLSFEREDMVTSDHGMEMPKDGEISDTEVVFDETTGEPIINWNADAFVDGDTPEERKVAIPMLRFSANDNCMACHRTSNSRRGFYGFGENAEADLDDDGLIVEDYQDDVHKGKIWTEANGESRTIENCNVCHSRNYYNPLSASADMNASHDFLKGNSDMDVRNDLDYNPNAKSCEYCHDNSDPTLAVQANPSGETNMQAAHETLWKLSGDMSGQPASEVEKITKAHLDVVSCQACHITDKAVRGTEFEPMFRYREAENGKQTIVPYKPKPRYFWKDNNTGMVLDQTQRNSVFREIKDDEGNVTGGAIFDPETGETLAEVGGRISHGSFRYNDPADYEGFAGLKMAYDKVFKSNGIENPDAVLVWSEPNQYLISHNPRPAVSSVQCEECHNYKQDGTTISALVSDDGIFGENNSYEVATIIDPKLVTDGIIVFDYPYMKMVVDEDGNAVVDEDGQATVRANVSDILAYSTVDPSMTALRSAVATAATAAAQSYTVTQLIDQAMASAGISNADDVTQLAAQLRNTNAFLFQSRQGDYSIRDVIVISDDEDFADYTLQVSIADDDTGANAAAAGLGDLVAGAEVFSLQFNKPSGEKQTSFNSSVLVKLPYSGSSSDADKINIITSTDGETWSLINPADILIVRAKTDMEAGYIVFQTTHFSFYTATEVADTSSTIPVDDSDDSDSSSGGGGSLGYLFLMFGLLLAVVRNIELFSIRK